MDTEPITLMVDAEAAKAYRDASPEEQEVFAMLLALRLRFGLGRRPRRSLEEIMDEVGFQAQARGMTSGILQSILDNGECQPLLL